MKERPIIFSGPEVLTILDGRKTQTRRVVKPQPESHIVSIHKAFDDECRYWNGWDGETCATQKQWRAPFEPGDLLIVREAMRFVDERFIYDADKSEVTEAVFAELIKRPWIREYMPATIVPWSASRLTLSLTGVRCERLQDTSENDAIWEGHMSSNWDSDQEHDTAWKGPRSARATFHFAWDSLNAKCGHPWESNPWVFVGEFKMLGDGS